MDARDKQIEDQILGRTNAEVLLNNGQRIRFELFFQNEIHWIRPVFCKEVKISADLNAEIWSQFDESQRFFNTDPHVMVSTLTEQEWYDRYYNQKEAR